jgi:hypothetical protein
MNVWIGTTGAAAYLYKSARIALAAVIHWPKRRREVDPLRQVVPGKFLRG